MLQLEKWLTDYVSQKLKSIQATEAPEIAAEILFEEGLQKARVSPPPDIQERLLSQVLVSVIGYGTIQPLLNDQTITEIMINRYDSIYIERSGQIKKTDIRLRDEEAVIRLINQIIIPLGRRIDRNNPTVDARLPDGSRVNAVIPPAAIDGANVTIRKFPADRIQMEDLLSYNSLSEHMVQFLKACVVSRLNIVISGGTGSGKTTLLNILSEFIPAEERIVTIEDSAELQLHQDHVLRLESVKPDIHGEGEVSIRHLVRNALRMRPDRIVVGEVRGGETLDMLQAMNTGHDGSLTTTHANSPRDAISRLETLTLMSGFDLPLRVIREQIASAVDLIVQVARMRDGSRKVTSITEILGMEGDIIVMNEIFKFEESGLDKDNKVEGEFAPTGMRPIFEPRLNMAGFSLPPEMFGADRLSIQPPRTSHRR
ncbi:MAG: CpaF family protein [Anaerolineales bacterium]|nr:CpaF family protein [Anaerolineales bacterium]